MIVEAGRPLTIGGQIAKVDSVLYSFHAGTMAGPAIADLVWGAESPSGKLPVTFPKVVGQIPLYYNHANTGRPPRPDDFSQDGSIDDTVHRDLGNNSNYIDIGPYPLYPFGFGLSYTTFEYGQVELSTNKLGVGGTLKIRASNEHRENRRSRSGAALHSRRGKFHGAASARAYGFSASANRAGANKGCSVFSLRDSLGFYNPQEQRIVEPGRFEIYVGGNSSAKLGAKFDLTE